EVRQPRRLVPRAILLSCACVGLIYVFCIWAEVCGLGPAATNRLTGASTPWNDLASRYASWLKWPVIIASVSSMFAVMFNSPIGGAALIVALLVGQIAEQTAAPYTWLPWAIVAWVASAAAGAVWLARARPLELRRAGALLAAGGESEPASPAVAMLAR